MNMRQDKHDTLRIPTREEFHRHFGGKIYNSDFDTDHRGKDEISSPIAERIERDFRREQKLFSGKGHYDGF